MEKNFLIQTLVKNVGAHKGTQFLICASLAMKKELKSTGKK